jgi:putative FmdB family regulatory protein
MPIYEYHCNDCDSSFEMLVGKGESSVACPTCQGINLKREMSLFAAGRDSGAAALKGGPSNGSPGGCCGGGCGCG